MQESPKPNSLPNQELESTSNEQKISQDKDEAQNSKKRTFDAFAEEKEVIFLPSHFENEETAEEEGESEMNEDEVEPKPKRKHRGGRRKIEIEYITEKSRRHITFSKRKGGLMKKAYELSTLTGTEMIVLIASETGHVKKKTLLNLKVYTFATPKLQPIITNPEGKALIQTCLNQGENETYDEEMLVDIPSEMQSNSMEYHPQMLYLAQQQQEQIQLQMMYQQQQQQQAQQQFQMISDVDTMEKPCSK